MAESIEQKFLKRRSELEKLSDNELKELFWQLADRVVEPMIDYGKKYTSPSIERSVLLRMGIDSITSQAVVKNINEAGLLGKGAGKIVLDVSKKTGISIIQAAKQISEDKKLLTNLKRKK